MTWRSLAENDLPSTDSPALTAVIIGRDPSKGARSPLLWNAAFDRLGLDGRMFPVDVASAALPDLLAALRSDSSVIGGAVAMPHKATVIPHLAGTDAVADGAGAVNAFVRKDGGLVGSNTDGVAALRSIERSLGPLDGARVLLVGTGGAGSAVAAAVAPVLGTAGELVLANRRTASAEYLATRLQSVTSATVITAPTWPVTAWSDAGAFDVVVNATSLGHASPVEDAGEWIASRFVSPIAGADGYPRHDRDQAAATTAAGLRGTIAEGIERTLAWLDGRTDTFVLDVIYQPERTLLLALAELAGCRTMNGNWMNLEQAVIAFSHAVSRATGMPTDDEEVRAAMRAAIEEG